MIRDEDLERLVSQYSFANYEILEIFQGGNSKVIKLLASDGLIYGLKWYAGDLERRKRSLDHEIEAYRVLGESTEIPMPKFKGYSFEIPSLLYQWVDGMKPKDVERAKMFLLKSFRCLKGLFNENKSSKIAVDAVSNLSELRSQIDERKFALDRVTGIPREISRSIKRIHKYVFSNTPHNFTIPIDTLSFSDHGIHNLLETRFGDLIFIDFEFFGIDSTSKLICDLYLHPQGIYTSKELSEFNYELNSISDSYIFNRVLLPTFALKWIYIILKRSIDWEKSLFIDRKSSAENTMIYIEYVDSLIREQAGGIPKTYLEFKNMRQ